jgi:DNA-binding winged helix-turn-helix (wHTH) protein
MKSRLTKRVWSGTVVENRLNPCISQLPAVLGGAPCGRFTATLTRKGNRFVAGVTRSLASDWSTRARSWLRLAQR